MEELGEFSDKFKENQKLLAKKQQEFEVEEKERIDKKDEFDLADKKRMKLISWGVIIAMLILILILGISLL